MAYVYLLGDYEKENMYKIGLTKGKIENRIKKLQTGNGGEIYLIDKFETDFPYRVETLVHNMFFSNKVKGEWYELSLEERKTFKEKCERADDIARVMNEENFFSKGKVK